VAQGRQGPALAQLPDSLRSGEDVILEDDAEWSRLEIDGDFSAEVATRVDVSECHITAASFTSSDLPRSRIGDTVFDSCELSGAAFHGAALTRVEFRECRMRGFSLAEAQLRDVTFFDCRLDEADLRMAVGERVAFERCSLTGADLYAARLAQLRLYDCDLTGMELSQADMTGARLHGSTLADLRGARYLGGVVIDSDQVIPLALAMFDATGVTVDDDRG
jgi:uncharacterized protein YjbI with pentapeptide repeats